MAHPCRLRIDVARARLAALGLTQTALAQACDVELRTLQRWFAGAGVSLVDAELVARTLSLGTDELFSGVPDDGRTVFSRLRDVMQVLGERNGALAQALRLSLERFAFIDAHVSFATHPRRGFVYRLPMPEATRRRFHVLRIAPRGAATDARVAFHAQVGVRFRYAFGEVVRSGERARLVEHFHTRTMHAQLDEEGAFRVWIWVPSEMRETVIVSDTDLDVSHEGEGGHTFDLRAAHALHAVCFRPAPMHLRDAGLPPTFDRLVGPREGRVDTFP